MSWNYRVFRTRFADSAGGEEDLFTVREAYYEAGHLWGISSSQAGARASGTTLTDLMKDHAMMQQAFTRPVLTPQDVPGYVYEAGEVAHAAHQG